MTNPELVSIQRRSPYIDRSIDNTALASFMECPRKFYYSMILNRRKGGLSKPALSYGTTWHAILETHYKTGGDFSAIKDAAIASWQPHDNPDDHRTLERALKAYVGYISRWGDHSADSAGNGRTVGFPDTPVVELATELWWEGALHPYAGKIDRVFELQGLYYVEDHKAQPLDARVLTPSGWTTIGKLKVGDLVFDRKGQAQSVTGVFPQGKLQVFRITFSDGTSTECANTHLWTVQDSHDKSHRWQTIELSEIQKRLAAAPYKRFAIPLVDPVQFDEQPVPLDPYVLGCLIGDGYLAGSSISLSATELDLIERFKLLLPENVELHKAHPNNNSWTIAAKERGSNAVRDGLAALNLIGSKSETKFIPSEYLYNTINTRRAILAGLLDTDGCVNAGIVTYTTVSKQLADDMCELVRGLGGVAQYHQRTFSKNNKQISYRVHIRLAFNPFALVRKQQAWIKQRALRKHQILSKTIHTIEALDACVEQVCILVDSDEHLYITDQYIVTHNTTSQLGANYFYQFDPSNQMMGYAVLAQELTGLPIAGVRINAHGVLKTQDKFERKIVTYSQPRLAEWKKNYNMWVGRLENSLMLLKPEFIGNEELSTGVRDPEATLLEAFPHQFNACAAKYGMCQYAEVCTSPPHLRTKILDFDFDEVVWDPMSAADAEAGAE